MIWGHSNEVQIKANDIRVNLASINIKKKILKVASNVCMIRQ